MHARRAIALVLLLAVTLAAPASARVVRFVIDAKVSPAFGGATFGSAGQYETIAGRVFGELDPTDPLNAIIQDIQLAPGRRDAAHHRGPAHRAELPLGAAGRRAGTVRGGQ